MADDLKLTLAKVLASEGKERFFFAHGTGKRKVGKGDGERVARGKKPPNAEIDGQSSELKVFFRTFVKTGKFS